MQSHCHPPATNHTELVKLFFFVFVDEKEAKRAHHLPD